MFVDVIADGKLYLSTTEHSPDSPYYKDTRYRCINATTGEEIWTLMGWGTVLDAGCDIIADGFFVFLNCYDMQIYCVGKGPSATSVSIQNDVTTLGNKVLVKGTVTDIAAGTKQNEQVARFPYSVPAVSDESMTAWMEYV
jgi:outer membrane protein assembly factor BamB